MPQAIRTAVPDADPRADAWQTCPAPPAQSPSVAPSTASIRFEERVHLPNDHRTRPRITDATPASAPRPASRALALAVASRPTPRTAPMSVATIASVEERLSASRRTATRVAGEQWSVVSLPRSHMRSPARCAVARVVLGAHGPHRDAPRRPERVPEGGSVSVFVCLLPRRAASRPR